VRLRAEWPFDQAEETQNHTSYRCVDCPYALGQQARLEKLPRPHCLRSEGPVDYTQFGATISASIVIPFHHEELGFVHRTIDSIVLSVPPRLLREIILVDDANFEPEWRAQRDAVAAYHPTVRVVSAPVRLGLVQAKNLGAAAARAPYIIFLESHVEVLGSWFTELLAPVVADESGRTIVVPHLLGIQEAPPHRYYTQMVAKCAPPRAEPASAPSHASVAPHRSLLGSLPATQRRLSSLSCPAARSCSTRSHMCASRSPPARSARRPSRRRS